MKTGTHQVIGRWVGGYGAALWALIFTLLHVAWAAGWYIGLPEEQARAGFQQTWFLVYNIVTAGMCALAVLVALALVQAWGHHLPYRPLIVLAWCGTALLVVRSSIGVTQIAYHIGTGTYSLHPTDFYEGWFCLGAVLFSYSLWQFQRAH